jgi:predicted CoA-binding protein
MADDIKTILSDTKTIAVVGLSQNPDRASYAVAKYLISKGYEVIPVNPGQKEILGKTCYKSLYDIPKDIKIDMVDVFRRSEDTLPVAKAAVEIGAKTLWLQLGITNEEAKKSALEGGLNYVENKCTKIEHSKYLG